MGQSPEALERRRERDRRRAKAKNKAYYEKNKARENARCREYRLSNREQFLATKAAWREANREQENAKAIARRQSNIEEYRERERLRRKAGTDFEYQRAWREANAERERQRRWHIDNPDRSRAKCAARRAALLRATPQWADLEMTLAIYTECIEISERTGVPHEVDHIIPLKGKNVCGLHVPSNLRVIPKRLNRAKGNKLIEAAIHEPVRIADYAGVECESIVPG